MEHWIILDGHMEHFCRNIQMACIEEHLNRGIRDFAIHLSKDCYVDVISEMMEDRARCIDDDIFNKLRHIYHELKNIIAEIRLGGQELKRFHDGDVSWLTHLINVISDFHSLLNKNIQLNNVFKTHLTEFHGFGNPVKK